MKTVERKRLAFGRHHTRSKAVEQARGWVATKIGLLMVYEMGDRGQDKCEKAEVQGGQGWTIGNSNRVSAKDNRASGGDQHWRGAETSNKVESDVGALPGTAEPEPG